jgi:uncharacterized phage infection (PIP) family protein YhgE
MLAIRHHRLTAAALLGLLLQVVVAPAQEVTVEELQEAIIELQAKNETLQRGLVEANQAEKTAREQLEQVRLRLEALGKNLLDGGNERLVQAASDLQISSERIAELETAARRLANSTTEYLRQAVVSDPNARVSVETSLRELDAVLGLTEKPRPDVRTGTLQQARIVSIDQSSGMLVLNLGETQGAKIGMSFQLLRGQQPYAKAILADVRKGISGAFVELDAVAEAPRPGDLAVLITE